MVNLDSARRERQLLLAIMELLMGKKVEFFSLLMQTLHGIRFEISGTIHQLYKLILNDRLIDGRKNKTKKNNRNIYILILTILLEFSKPFKLIGFDRLQ